MASSYTRQILQEKGSLGVITLSQNMIFTLNF